MFPDNEQVEVILKHRVETCYLCLNFGLSLHLYTYFSAY